MVANIEIKKGSLRRYRYLRFSLRALLVLIAIVSILLGIAFRQARYQAQIVHLVKDGGGEVLYDYHEIDSKFYLDASSSTPRWLLDLLGLDFFHNVAFVSAHDVTDDVLKKLCTLRTIHALFLSESSVTNEGLAEINRLTNLHELQIDSPHIDDAALGELAALSNLRILEIFNAPVTDSGLRQLRTLTNLEILSLINTQVTPAGKDELGKALPHCTIYR